MMSSPSGAIRSESFRLFAVTGATKRRRETLAGQDRESGLAAGGAQDSSPTGAGASQLESWRKLAVIVGSADSVARP